MDQRTEQQVRESIAAVTKMYRDGTLAPEVYHKCLVALAYEYAVADDIMRAAALLQGVPVSYFVEHLATQMKEDEQYREIALTLAGLLVKAGVVTLGPKINPTMPPATA